jgi:hypothetical protein
MSISSVKSGITGISLALDNNFMEPIATTLVGSGGTSIITFNDIPQTYKHLQIRGIGRTNRSANGDYGLVRFNGDSSVSNYTSHYLQGNGTSAASGVYQQSFAGCLWSRWGAASDGSSIFGAGIFDILDYTNTNKYKTTRDLGGLETNTSNSQINFESTVWMANTEITSISIVPGAGTSWNQYSRFSLYGIKG